MTIIDRRDEIIRRLESGTADPDVAWLQSRGIPIDNIRQIMSDIRLRLHNGGREAMDDMVGYTEPQRYFMEDYELYKNPFINSLTTEIMVITYRISIIKDLREAMKLLEGKKARHAHEPGLARLEYIAGDLYAHIDDAYEPDRQLFAQYERELDSMRILTAEWHWFVREIQTLAMAAHMGAVEW